MFEVIILSAIQGITEFLPVSSSAHLILVSKYFNFSNSSLTLDVSLHLGSLMAIISYFKKDIFNLLKNRNFFIKILISSIPTIIVGYLLFRFALIDYLRNFQLIGWTTIIFGILLYFSDLKQINKSVKRDYTFKTAVYISFFQILSLIPGVSRSGITISGARLFNFSREDSVKISFLMSIPILAAVSGFNLSNLLAEGSFEFSVLNLIGIIFSFLFSFLTIKFLLIFLKRFSFTYFVIYRIALGVLILCYTY
jgi:undecaprenyl-diphosphatase|tara:strand:+ start:2957 stop:3712 length:756 start_codon:yes stop_codon:yes gene_type:complete